METADELLEKISTEGIATPHNENRSLEMQPAETSLTTRNDPNNLFGEVPLKSDGGVNSVPLPEEIDDDLDF